MPDVSRALESLEPSLRERTRTLGSGTPHVRYVLYWMRTAVRADENPALEVALALAEGLGVPAFVYHAVSERYPYASDRHHTFLLEGARDVAEQLRERGVGSAFHLERAGERGPHLRTLAHDAGLVVTEDMPVAPLVGWTEALSSVVPVALVDTACVVPMRLTRRPERAFQYRAETDSLRAERLGLRLPTRSPGPRFVPELPFAPVDLEAADLGELVAACAIDHGVGPVPDTVGGSAAGYARWDAFVAGGLAAYAALRNDPTRDGVSRMSAYLHYGFVSPFRLAREARAAGAEKFLDELLVWRELAYAFCFHVPAHDTLWALPAWARETLAAHSSEAREPRSWETLARGRTGDTLWDLAQSSLLRHGELHNNVRMTWGKALLGWTRDPEEALAMLIDLNHRYALDGRDPASYGGLLWCLGLFDRPFPPATPVRGALRARPTEPHARRMKLEAYRARVCRPAQDLGSVAVIGAGVAGLACARTLHDHGVPVTVFDKGRRVGGRMNHRRDHGSERARSFDHGAQYLTAKDPRFAHHVRAWLDDGVLGWWSFSQREADGSVVEMRRPLGAKSMRSLAEHLASDATIEPARAARDSNPEDEKVASSNFDIRLETEVAPLSGRTLYDTSGAPLGLFDRVVVTAPLAQARGLLADHPRLVEALGDADHAPCWCVMADWAEPIGGLAFDALRGDGALAWAAREASKRGREAGHRWVLQASPEWSEQHLEDEPEVVCAELLAAFAAGLGVSLPPPTYARAHRWRYARVRRAVGVDCLYDAAAGIAVAGDGLLGPRIESAWLSGVAAAGRILGSAGAPGHRVWMTRRSRLETRDPQ